MEKNAAIPDTRLSREQWLERALEHVGRTGGKLRIDDLVAALGVTKGSFYWHFKDRADFVSSLADYWAKTYTRVVPATLEERGGSAQQRLRQLLEMVTNRRLGRHELAMRAWAKQEPEVAGQVARVDRYRFRYVRGLFEEMGFRGADLDMRAAVFVALQTGKSVTFDPGMRTLLRNSLGTEHALFVGKR